MKLKKIKSLKIHNNNIYFLTVTDHNIITNNGYLGILIFDKLLKLKKELTIFDELIIYSSFTYNEELLLYCPDNQCLVYINLKNDLSKIISLNSIPYTTTFSKLYYWNDSKILLASYTDEYLYAVSTTEGTITPITDKQIQHINPLFNKIWKDCQNKPVIFYNQKESVIILKDCDTQVITILDYRYNKKEIIHYPLQNTHGFIYQEGNLLFVSEMQLQLITNQKKFLEIAKDPWIFLRANFFSSTTIAVLLSDRSKPENDELRIYEF